VGKRAHLVIFLPPRAPRSACHQHRQLTLELDLGCLVLYSTKRQASIFCTHVLLRISPSLSPWIPPRLQPTTKRRRLPTCPLGHEILLSRALTVFFLAFKVCNDGGLSNSHLGLKTHLGHSLCGRAKSYQLQFSPLIGAELNFSWGGGSPVSLSEVSLIRPLVIRQNASNT